MKLFVTLFFSISLFAGSSNSLHDVGTSQQSSQYIQASVQLIDGIKNGADVSRYQKDLAKADPELLARELSTDGLRRTFWINVYNAYVILLLKDHPELYEDRGEFFKEPRFTIAGQQLSFDDVEHGILRRSKNKLSLGFLNKLIVPRFEKKFRVDAVDARIHFALNCGAKSCPPVKVYHPDRVEEELNKSAADYLRKVTEIQEEGVLTTVLFSWFRNDFSDRGGITAYLKKYGALPPSAGDPSISFSDYDWTLDINNFID